MKIRVIDFETTDDHKARIECRPAEICEYGYTDVVITDGGPIIARPCSELVDPGMPMTIGSIAVHHITDKDVVGAITPDEARTRLLADMSPGDMFAAHFVEFERAFFPANGFDWICTHACARHLIKDSPKYSNQYLRYHLGVDEEFLYPDNSMPPHRAGPDSYVTAHILKKLLQISSQVELAALTWRPVLLEVVGFGQHEGRKWSELPKDYLDWILRKDFDKDTKYTAQYWLDQPAPIGF